MKDSFEIYLTGETKYYNATIRITLETERRAKYRDVVFSPSANEPKQKKIFIGGSGRRFRLIIEWTAPVSNIPSWRLLNGILVRCSIDRD